MERKIFWISFTVLGLLADFVLPLWWALGATIPIVYFSWWMAYRSGWFEYLMFQSQQVKRVGVLRLRRRIRFANPPAPLRMTRRI